MKKFVSTSLAIAMTLAATPAFAAPWMMPGDRVTKRQLQQEAFIKEKTRVTTCDDLMGVEKGKCLNEQHLKAGAMAKTKMMRMEMEEDNDSDTGMGMGMMMRTQKPMKGDGMNDGSMMMMRKGEMMQRVSKRSLKGSMGGREALVEKCKALKGMDKTVCLNPKVVKEKKAEVKAAMTWYKLDDKGALWWSTDGKEWKASEAGTWKDKDGHWLKVGEGKLWWSADMGKTWAQVPEWTWKAADNKWYKFDASWKLWMSSDSGASWAAATMWPGM